jgi:hypothetical protein
MSLLAAVVMMVKVSKVSLLAGSCHASHRWLCYGMMAPSR